jgi:hypothetical protein
MRYILLVLFINGSLLSFAQPNWKDSVKIKEPVLDAYMTRDILYYKTKKGWGIYDYLQQWKTVEAGFDFILATEDFTDHYAAVKKGKLVLLGKDLKPLNKKTYSRVGSAVERSDAFTIENNEAIYPRQPGHSNYAQLDNRSENTLTLFNTYVLVNFFRQAEQPSPALDKDGNMMLDSNEHVIMNYSLPLMKSGIYDLKTKSWVIEPRYAKIGLIGNTILVKDVLLGQNELIEKVHVYNSSLEKTGAFLITDRGLEKKGLKLVLADYTSKETEDITWNSWENRYVKFDNGKTQGIFDAMEFNFPVDSGKYEFVLVPRSFPYTIFTIKNKKVGTTSGLEEITTFYDNEYSRLGKKQVFVNSLEREFNVMECNGNDMESIVKDDTVKIGETAISNLKLPVKNASVEVIDDFVIVQDFIPKPQEENYEIYETSPKTGNDTVVFRFEQGISQGGVFNLETRKWIVPRVFTKIMKAPAGFSCMRLYNDSLTFSFYSPEGKPLFKNISKDELCSNYGYVAKFTGIEYTGAGKRIALDRGLNQVSLILNEKEKSGVFDLLRMSWIVKPVYDVVEDSKVYDVYVTVKNKKTGLVNGTGKILGEPVFSSVVHQASFDGFILGDSIFIYMPTGISIPVDSLKSDSELFCYESSSPCIDFEARIFDQKLFVNESIGLNLIDETGMELFKRDFYSRSISLSGYDVKKFTNALKVYPWNGYYYVLDTNNSWHIRNEKEENLFNPGNPIFLQRDIAFSVLYAYWYFDDNGELAKYTTADYETGIFPEHVAGVPKRFFANGKELAPPADFVLLAANKQGTGIGFSVVPIDGNFQRKYKYYNFNTGEYSPCELVEFCDKGGLDILPYKDGFVFMESCYGKQSANVLLVAEDLKTVNSTFNDIVSFEAIFSNYPIYRYLVYKLTTGKNEILFDRDFQFLQECPAGSFEFLYPSWNRLVLKSAPKTIIMKLDGQVIKK